MSNGNRSYQDQQNIVSVDNPYSLIYSVAGWVVGMVLVSALNVVDANNLGCTDENMQTLLLGNGSLHSFVIGEDFVVSGYTGTTTLDSNTGGNRNQGRRTAWMYKTFLFADALPTLFISMNYSYTTSNSKCFFEKDNAPLLLIVFLLGDKGELLKADSVTFGLSVVQWQW